MPTETPTLTTRELPPTEWDRVARIEPFDTGGLPPDNGYWTIFVAEVGDEIVGCVSVHTQVHVDPWWIAPGHPTVARALLRAVLPLLDANDVAQVFCTIADTKPHSTSIAERLGWTPAPGKLYLMIRDQLREWL